MDIIFKVTLILHIVGGAVGLLTGTLNLIGKKGDKKHKLIGKVFFVSMLASGASSLVLAYLHPNYFLFMVGVFTLYMVGSGQRYLKHKQLNASDSKALEWTITALMLLAGLLFVGIGVYTLVKSNLFGLVFVVFGGLGLMFVRQDFKNYKGKSTVKNYWLVEHLQRMTGSVIAAMTAYLVVNSMYFPEQIPAFVYWLLPTAVLTPLIVKWSRKYEVKRK